MLLIVFAQTMFIKPMTNSAYSRYYWHSEYGRPSGALPSAVKRKQARLMTDFGSSPVISIRKSSRIASCHVGGIWGLGIEINMDQELKLVRIIAPIADTPAYRAGLKAAI